MQGKTARPEEVPAEMQILLDKDAEPSNFFDTLTASYKRYKQKTLKTV